MIRSGDLVGDTPLIPFEGIFVKLECANPGGSVKDRIAHFMVEAAERRGELKHGDVIVEATSGNTGIALAMVARTKGYPLIIFMPEHMSVERRQILERLGADVRLVSREGSFAEAVEQRDVFRGRPGYYVPDQFSNPDNTRCHRETTAVEMIRQLRVLGCTRLDAFVAGVGTGGTLMGIGEALRETMPRIRIAAVEPEESAVMSGGEAGEHGIMGIGDGFIPDLVDTRQIDDVIRVSTAEANAKAHSIRERHGFCVGVSAGANTVAALRLAREGFQVATLWPDCADRYISVGLEPPSSSQVTCPLREACDARSRARMGEDTV